jgi:hypothetical protein
MGYAVSNFWVPTKFFSLNLLLPYLSLCLGQTEATPFLMCGHAALFLKTRDYASGAWLGIALMAVFVPVLYHTDFDKPDSLPMVERIGT